VPFHPSEQRSYKIFRVFSCLFVVKKWVVGGSPRQAFSCLSWLKTFQKGVALMKIMIMTDLEGVAGILNAEDWTRPDSRYYDKGKAMLTAEVNAATQAFLDNGFTEVIVNDGHGSGAIDPNLLHVQAKLIRGATKPIYPWGLDRSFAAFAFVGQHAKSRTSYSHLTHTGAFSVLSCAVNGYEIGEFGQCAYCAWELGIPTIFASGEKAFCVEAEELAPGIVTAAVKEGLLEDEFDHYDAKSFTDAMNQPGRKVEINASDN
jgi:D-aminopeptidase